jgi:hypothetical protein
MWNLNAERTKVGYNIFSQSMLHITPVTGDYKDEVNLFIDLMKENIKNCKGIFKKFIFR